MNDYSYFFGHPNAYDKSLYIPFCLALWSLIYISAPLIYPPPFYQKL